MYSVSSVHGRHLLSYRLPFSSWNAILRASAFPVLSFWAVCLPNFFIFVYSCVLLCGYIYPWPFLPPVRPFESFFFFLFFQRTCVVSCITLASFSLSRTVSALQFFLSSHERHWFPCSQSGTRWKATGETQKYGREDTMNCVSLMSLLRSPTVGVIIDVQNCPSIYRWENRRR